MVTDETFFAWLDGELHGDEAAKVSAEVAADPALAAKAEQHRAMQQRL
jgi:anti-sigma factor RsiW